MVILWVYGDVFFLDGDEDEDFSGERDIIILTGWRATIALHK